MCKVLVFGVFLVLFSCSSVQTFGQAMRDASPPANETSTEAERLLQEGIEYTQAGQLAQAVRAFQDAIRLNPDYADAYAALGRAYFKMREWRLAVDNLHRAAALNAKQRQTSIVSQAQPAPANPGPTVEPSLPNQPSTSAASSQSQKVPDASAQKVLDEITTETRTSDSAAPSAVAVAQPSPQVTQDAEPTREVPSVKIEPASAPEEKQEATGTSVSMSAPPAAPTVSPAAPTTSPEAPTASPAVVTIETAPASPIPLKPSTEDVSLTKIYRVGPGDVLDIRVNEAQPQQSTLFTVTPAGLLEHPLLPEPLTVATLTPEEIQTKIQDDLKKRALIEEPTVTVAVRDYASHSILVSGLVKDSGTKFLRREAIPLYVVVADAQPLPEAAKVTVVRNEQNQMFEVDLTNVVQMNLLVRSGDVINLQPNETQFVYVGGEVKEPGEKIFRRGLTLTQAIISAGGVTSKSKVAEISRDDGEGYLLKTTFKLKDIQTGKIMDPLISAGDRITILR